MRTRAIAILAVFAALVGGCTGTDENPTPPIPPGGTLRVGVLGTFGQCPMTICAPYASDPQVSYWNLGYELGRCCLLRSLLSFNGRPTAGGGAVPRPDLAAELPEISPDGLTWTFHIRRGIRYGPPLQDVTVTAADFVRSIERLIGPRPVTLPQEIWGDIQDFYLGTYLNLAGILEGGEEYGNGSTEHISGLETPDDHTLIAHLTEPTGTLGALLSFPDTAPIPANPFAPDARFGIATDQGRYFMRYLAATGPYMVEGADQLDYSKPPEEWQQPVGDGAATYTLVRNPSWSPASDPLRTAALDRIVISRIANNEDALELVSRGALDLVWDWAPTPEQVAKARSTPGVTVNAASGDNVRIIGMNVAVPPLDDVHVRRAIAFAVDRPAVAEVFASVGGLGGRVMTHVGLDSQENNLLLNFDPFDSRDGPDLDAARREMAESRYDRDHDGLCDAAVCSGIELLSPADDQGGANGLARARAAKLVARQLESIGLGIRPKLLAGPEAFGSLYGRPEAHIAMRMDAWFKDTSNGAIWFPPLFGGSSLSVTGVPQSDYLIGASPKDLERWGYDVREVPSVDAAMTTCLGLAFEAQLQCWAELDRHLTEDIVPWVPLLETSRYTLLSDRVAGFSVDQSSAEPVAALDQIVVTGEAPVASPAPQPEAFPDIPSGIYRTSVTAASLRRAGFPMGAREDVLNETGTFTMVIGDGVWFVTQRADHPISGSISLVGTYQGAGETIRFREIADSFEGNLLPPMHWSFDGSRLRLTMGRCDLGDPAWCAAVRAHYTGQPWEKIG